MLTAACTLALGFVVGQGAGWFSGPAVSPPRPRPAPAATPAAGPISSPNPVASVRLPAGVETVKPTVEKAAPPLQTSRASDPALFRATPPRRSEPPAVSSGPAAAGRLFDPPRTRERFEGARVGAAAVDPAGRARLVEWRSVAGRPEAEAYGEQPIRVEYSLDEALTAKVFKILRRGRVEQGTAIVMDPRTGRLLAYVSTDEDTLPAERAYPAASIVKILTSAALLEEWGPGRESICVYRGNKYRLNRRRLMPPDQGLESSLESAIASSNNQCFAQWALHSVGEKRLRSVFQRFGWLTPPAPGHAPGEVEVVTSDLDLGRLGSGLDGVRVTPLHVAQLGSILTLGDWVEPWWIDRLVDASGKSLERPERLPNRPVLEADVAARLRRMMVATTQRGTARSAFRDRRGRPRLGSIEVAGKTGNLSGRNPHGRYEWFFGLAPAEDPQIAVAVLQLQGHMWWRRSTELGSDLLREVFCDRNGCEPELAARVTGKLDDWSLPLLIADLEEPPIVAHSR